MAPFEFAESREALKKIIESVLVFVGICLAVSFCMSGIRAMGHDECHWEYQSPEKKDLGMVKVCPDTPCRPMFIDKAEPLLSTRWFCEIR